MYLPFVVFHDLQYIQNVSDEENEKCFIDIISGRLIIDFKYYEPLKSESY